MNTETMLKVGKALVKAHELEQRAKKARDEFRKRFCDGNGYFTSSEWHHNGVVLDINLSQYVESYPDAKPTLTQWLDEERHVRRGYMKYPAQWVGEIKPGFHFWVQSSTPVVDLEPPPKTEEKPVEAVAVEVVA